MLFHHLAPAKIIISIEGGAEYVGRHIRPGAAVRCPVNFRQGGTRKQKNMTNGIRFAFFFHLTIEMTSDYCTMRAHPTLAGT
jgi:hypothetical protein